MFANGFVPSPQKMHDASSASAGDLLVDTVVVSATSGRLQWEGLKLAMLTLVVAMARIVIGWLSSSLKRLLFVRATFRERDMSYEWIHTWLHQQPFWQENERNVTVATSPVWFGIEESESEKTAHSDRPRYVPSLKTSYVVWRGLTRVSIVVTELARQDQHTPVEKRIDMSLLTRNRRTLDELVNEARMLYETRQLQTIPVKVPQNMTWGGSPNWYVLNRQPKRSLRSIVLDEEIKEDLLKDVRNFLRRRSWYTARGIPYRRGFLLRGPPGCGKSSTIFSLASELGLSIYILALSEPSLDDGKLRQLMRDVPERSIVLLEDIDVAFMTSRPKVTASEIQRSPPGEDAGKVTLSGLLNVLDGIGAAQGRILFATTNCYSVLDPALIRPGRIDREIEFNLATPSQARQLFKLFYSPDVDSGSEKGYDLDVLSLTFSEAIPDGKFSVAKLQGYLLNYQEDPCMACTDVAKWVREESSPPVQKPEAEAAHGASSETPKDADLLLPVIEMTNFTVTTGLIEV